MFIMNRTGLPRTLIVLFITFNVLICVYLWLHWKSLPDIQETAVKDHQVFVPTKDWKPIGKYQPIPKGLHVRINLQTGEREAKLLETDEKSDHKNRNSIIHVEDEAETNVGNADVNKWKYEVIKESLKKIKNEDEKNDGQPKRKFRSYEELKKEFAELNLNIKTDAEILDDLFKQFDEKYEKTGKLCSEEEPELKTILENLENLLHQGDNAEEFAKQNGFGKIIIPCLSSNSTSMRTISARALGAAVQNNPNVQISALRANVVNPLLKTVALLKDYKARASSIFALSCLIRSFPLAEMKLIEEGGLDVLMSLFDEGSADALKLQMKVVSLFYDLTFEKEDAEQTIKEERLTHNVTSDNETVLKEMQQMQERLKQYNKVDMKTKLIERGWCSKLSHLLAVRMPDTNFADESDVHEEAVNHDIVDKVSTAMLSFAVECREQFLSENRFQQILNNLLTYYKRMMTKDELDFYNDIYQTIQKLNVKLNS